MIGHLQQEVCQIELGEESRIVGPHHYPQNEKALF